MVEDISLSVTPQSKRDGEILREVSLNYDFEEPNGNIDQIDGIVVSMKDWENVSKGMQMRLGTVVKIRRPIRDRELIIDPDLWQLFRGYELDAERLLKTQIFSPDVRRTYREISTSRDPRNKLFKQVSELYPKLDKEYVKKSLEFQKREGADLLISPSPPITSVEYLDKQLGKMQEMNEISRGYVDSGLLDGDLMNILTIVPKILESSRTREKLLDAISNPRTDLVGVKLLDLENLSQAENTLNLIKGIKQNAKAKRIYLFYVLEFGYVAYCYGVNTVVVPMRGTPPYIRSRRRPPKTTMGSYYHPRDMTYYSHRELLAETRSQNYRFPCHCRVCTKFGTITQIEKGYWNRFRRIHFLLTKNTEIAELRSTTVPLSSALIDKFSRSKQTTWIPLLG